MLAAGASVAFGRGCPAGPPIPAPWLIAAGFDAADILATRAPGQFIIRVEGVGGMEQFGVLALPPAVGVLAFHFHGQAPGQLRFRVLNSGLDLGATGTNKASRYRFAEVQLIEVRHIPLRGCNRRVAQ